MKDEFVWVFLHPRLEESRKLRGGGPRIGELIRTKGMLSTPPLPWKNQCTTNLDSPRIATIEEFLLKKLVNLTCKKYIEKLKRLRHHNSGGCEKPTTNNAYTSHFYSVFSSHTDLRLWRWAIVLTPCQPGISYFRVPT